MSSPFHGDELRAQELAAEHPASVAGIRSFMPDQHRDFFRRLSYLFAAVPDAAGWPIATVLTGPPGFVHSPDPTTLRIDAQAAAHDPAAPGLCVGGEVGLLGLDLATRRRNRANGAIAAVDGRGVTVAVRQSFGNCAQYIRTRHTAPRAAPPVPSQALAGLDDATRRLVGSADTFFVASRSRASAADRGGLDISHRGGKPGFIGLDGDALVVPDFRGNRFYNTLGNLLGDPRTGLLLIDFDTGDIVQLQGTATIEWGSPRRWRFEPTRGWRRPKAFPFSSTFGAFAPTTLAS